MTLSSLKAAGNKQEEDKLAKQFTDLYGTLTQKGLPL